MSPFCSNALVFKILPKVNFSHIHISFVIDLIILKILPGSGAVKIASVLPKAPATITTNHHNSQRVIVKFRKRIFPLKPITIPSGIFTTLPNLASRTSSHYFWIFQEKIPVKQQEYNFSNLMFFTWTFLSRKNIKSSFSKNWMKTVINKSFSPAKVQSNNYLTQVSVVNVKNWIKTRKKIWFTHKTMNY